MQREVVQFGILRGMSVASQAVNRITKDELLELRQQLEALKFKGNPTKNVLQLLVWGPLDDSEAAHTLMTLAKGDGWTVVVSTRGRLYYPWFREANLVEVVLENNEDWLMFPVNSVVWDVCGQQTIPQLVKNEPQLGLVHQGAQKHVVGIGMDAYETVMEGTQFLWTLN